MKNPWIGLNCVQVMKEHLPSKIIKKAVIISPNYNLHCLYTVPINFASKTVGSNMKQEVVIFHRRIVKMC